MTKFFLSFFLCALFFLTSCATTPQEKSAIKDKKAKIYYNQGTRQLINKDYTDALVQLKKAYQIEPDNSLINNNLAMAYFFKKSYSKSYLHLSRALEIDPQNIDAKVNLGNYYITTKKFHQAIKILEETSKVLTYKAHFRTYYNLGVAYEELNNFSKAKEYYQLSLNEYEGYCPSHFKLGELYKREKNYSKAKQHFQDSRKGTCYNNSEPLIALIDLAIQMGELNQAQEYIEELQTRFSDEKTSLVAQRKRLLLQSIYNR